MPQTTTTPTASPTDGVIEANAAGLLVGAGHELHFYPWGSIRRLRYLNGKIVIEEKGSGPTCYVVGTVDQLRALYRSAGLAVQRVELDNAHG